jgi:DNA-binding transcriptional MerR regulator
MRTGKVADMLGVDQKTILNWTDRPEFTQFFSEDARGLGRTMGRDYTEVEVVILNTIRTERQKNTAWSDIARLLESGTRDTELPPNALLVDTTTPLAQYGKMQQMQLQIDNLTAELERVHEEMRQQEEKWRQELREKDAQIERVQNEKNTEVARIMNETNVEIERVLNEKNLEVERILKETSDQYTNKFTDQIAQLHEQIGDLKATIRMLRERYNAE